LLQGHEVAFGEESEKIVSDTCSGGSLGDEDGLEAFEESRGDGNHVLAIGDQSS